MDITRSQAFDESDSTMNTEVVSDVVQDLQVLVWLDTHLDRNSDYHKDIIEQLRSVFDNVRTFTEADQCVDFIESNNQKKVYMVISGPLGQHIVPCIHDMDQVIAIFILHENTEQYAQLARDCPKLKSVSTDISLIGEQLKQLYGHNTVSISLMATNDDSNENSLNQLDSSFMYTMILKDILLDIEYVPKHLIEFANYCRTQFADNETVLQHITKFEQEYHSETPVWWYTNNYFLCSMLNSALRTMDVDIIVRLGFFIKDLHRQIEQLHSEQFREYHSDDLLTVYRGQGVSKSDFDQLMKNKGGLLAFNNFLSTHTDRMISLMFAESNQANPDLVGVIFTITVDPSQSATSFASVRDVSDSHQEDEILFSTHSVFRIADIKQIDENNRLFEVNLILTSDTDRDLQVLTEHIREEIQGSSAWERLGKLLLKIGQFDKAEEVYQVVLDQTTDENERASLYAQLAKGKYERGEYTNAVELFEKSLEIKQRIFPSDDLRLADSYNNIGVMYCDMGDYLKALANYEKALAIQQKTLPANHPDLGGTYNNMGRIHNCMGDHTQALSYYEKALELQQQSLPPNHPNLGGSYNNIGAIYDDMGDYSKALTYYEKALQIRQQSLPSNHPDLSASYNNIGVAYDNMGDYSKALLNYEKALEIQQQTLPPNHPDLGLTYNNIGLVYNKMDDHAKALSNYEKALEIRQQSLPYNHPDLGLIYSNIGAVYFNMGDSSNALAYYQKDLDIREESLPPNHPDLGLTYNNIGLVHERMNDYLKAHSFYKRAMQIVQNSLPPNHPNLLKWKNNLERVENKL